MIQRLLRKCVGAEFRGIGRGAMICQGTGQCLDLPGSVVALRGWEFEVAEIIVCGRAADSSLPEGINVRAPGESEPFPVHTLMRDSGQSTCRPMVSAVDDPQEGSTT